MAGETEALTMVIGLWASGMGIGAGVYHIIRWYLAKRWHYDIVVFEKRDNGYNVIIDKANKFSDKAGRPTFKLKSEKREIKPVKYEDIQLAGKRNFAMLYSPNRDEYFSTQFALKEMAPGDRAKLQAEIDKLDLGIPITLLDGFKKGELSVMPDDMKTWFINRYRAAEMNWHKQPGFWEKYQGYLTMFISGFLIIIMIILFMQQMGNITGSLTQLTGQLVQLTNALVEGGIKVTALTPNTTAAITNPITGITGGLIPNAPV